MSSVQPSSSDRKSAAVAYGLPCADCGTYYSAQSPKCPTCSSTRRGAFTGNASARSKSKPASAPLSPVLAPPVTSATERIYSRLAYGLPCAKCGCYYSGDLKECPTCRSTQRGAPIFGPRAVPVSASPVSPASPTRGEALRGLGLPCAECGAYYSGDLAACIHCGSVRRDPFAKTVLRLGPTLVVSDKSAVVSPATSARPTTRVVRFGLPCAKCHSYYEAGRDACPSCGHRERQKIAAAPPAPQIAIASSAAEITPQPPALPPPLPSGNAAALAADIADLLIRKLNEPEPASSVAPVAAEEATFAPPLSAPEPTASALPPALVTAAQKLATETEPPAQRLLQEQVEIPAPVAETPAALVQEEVSVIPAISPLEIAPTVSAPLSSSETAAANVPPIEPALPAEEFATLAEPPVVHFSQEQVELCAPIAETLTPLVQEAVSVTPAISALEIAPTVSEPPAEPPPSFAFDLKTFSPFALPQHFVVETEPTSLDDSDSLTAAISRAVDRALRALRILPAPDQPALALLSSAPVPVRDSATEFVLEPLAATSKTPSAEEIPSALAEAAEPPLQASLPAIAALQPTAQDVETTEPENDLSETLSPDPAIVAAIEADAATFDLPPREEPLAPEAGATAVEPVVSLPEELPPATFASETVEEVQTKTDLDAPFIADHALVEPALGISTPGPAVQEGTPPATSAAPSIPETAFELTPPDPTEALPQPVREETSSRVEPTQFLLLPFPPAASLDCPTCYVTYDAALDSCPACRQAASALPAAAEVLAAVPLIAAPEPVIAIPAEPEITILRCVVCDTPYSVLETTCPACAKTADHVVMISAPAPIVDTPLTPAPEQPSAVLLSPAPEDAMTLIDALDFFEELTRKLRA